jgi:hypothetical protein
MDFLKGLLRNLALLLIIGVVLFILFPDTMKQVFQLYGALFGPLSIILVVVAALPRKRRRR